MRRSTLIVTLLIAFSACGDDDSAATTTTISGSTAGTEAASPTTVGDTTGGGIEVPGTIDLDDATLYREPVGVSYRMTLVFHFVAETPTGTVGGTQQVDGGKITDPPHFELTGRAGGGAPGPQCFAFHTLPGFIDPYDTFLREGGMLMGEAPLLADGLEVNGRTVDRYDITIGNIDPSDDAGSEVDQLTDGFIDIDREGRFVVRLVLIGRGRSALLTGDPALVGDIDYSLDFSEFGTITALQPPEGC